MSFSPCVYPLIPISLSYIGISSSGKSIRGFALSLIYVTGLATTYSLLGLIASLTGSIFGIVSTHPLTRISVGIIFIFFGLSLWDIFSFKTVVLAPRFKVKRKFIWRTFLLGAGSGFVISPCTSPVLGSILIFVATKKSILYGVTLLLTFAFGVGFIFILAGTFSAVLLSLPQSDTWMSYIKKIAAAILIGMGIYFIIIAVRGL